MPEPDFKQLRSTLLQAGIAPRHVRRTVIELEEHLEDLIDAEIAAGSDIAIARENAGREMGNLSDVAVAMCACPELQCWAYRYPRFALLIYPLTCMALLPVLPVIASVTHAQQVVRWSACLLFGGFVTAAMFLCLQLAIALT